MPANLLAGAVTTPSNVPDEKREPLVASFEVIFRASGKSIKKIGN
jgi:hypothetical protein